MDVDSIKARFVSVRSEIEKIMEVSGAVGLSYGVIHKGRLSHVESFGYRDKKQGLFVDSKTMFSICSMTKGLVASAVLGDLVEQRKFNWNDKIQDLVPSFAPQSAELRDKSTLIDVLSMRSGMERYNVWTHSDNRINFAQADSMKLINSLQSATELRETFAYNNWGYEIAENVIKKQTGETWDTLLHRNLFEPLGLKNTDATGHRDSFDNLTKSYMVLDNGDSVSVPMTPQSGLTIMGAAGGVLSCVDDLLKIYGSMVKACAHQFEEGVTSTSNNPFKHLKTSMSAHTILPGSSYHESSYGMGWIRTQLPNQMCKISPNYGMLGTAPIVGRGTPSKLIIAHYGSMPGSYSGVCMFPETESVIVVLINTTPRCDLADWMAQLLTQTLFDFPEKHDYVDWVTMTVDAELDWHRRLIEQIGSARKLGTSPGDLDAYIGKYYNAARTFMIEIIRNGESLSLAFEGREDEVFSLQHVHDGTFSWLQQRDELVKRARSVGQGLAYYLISFKSGNGGVYQLYWTHDSQMARGEKYEKA